MSISYLAVVGTLVGKLVGLVINLVRFPTVARPERADSDSTCSSTVSLLIPVRDEAHRIDSTLAGLLAQTVDELIFLDDESSDGSAELLRRRTRHEPHVRVVTGRPRPVGWTGKTWACQQLTDLARGEVLAFCDADVSLADGALEAARGEMIRQEADLFSVFPRQVTATTGERVLVPLIDDVLLCLLPHPLLRAPAPGAATANGSLILISRTALQRLGGWSSVQREIVEDVALARRTRALGLKLGLALGGDLVGTRMYTGYWAAVHGLARGLRPTLGGSRAAVVGAALLHLLVYSAPVLLLRRNRRWALPLTLAAVERLAVCAKTGRRWWPEVLFMPIAPVAALPVCGIALSRRQRWKGRTYCLAR